ncbi:MULTISPECIES: hypothetical protein [unclassified Ruminococcus]|nr:MULTISPECIES: hypothetical protein [unclassified Ruminococcus]
MFEDIFFAITYGIMGLIHDRKYGCLTAIVVAVVLIIIIGKLAY